MTTIDRLLQKVNIGKTIYTVDYPKVIPVFINSISLDGKSLVIENVTINGEPKDLSKPVTDLAASPFKRKGKSAITFSLTKNIKGLDSFYFAKEYIGLEKSIQPANYFLTENEAKEYIVRKMKSEIEEKKGGIQVLEEEIKDLDRMLLEDFGYVRSYR